MNKKFIITILIWIAFHQAIQAGDNLLWIGYNQIQSDYFSDGNSTIKPDGINFGYIGDISEQWQISVNYGKYTGEGVWPIDDYPGVFDQAETESQSVGLGLTWSADDYSISISYAQQENTEDAITRMPRVVENVNAEDRIYSVSYDNFVDFEQWIFSWGLGTQYADSKNRTHQTYQRDPVVETDVHIDQTSWSVFLDLDIGTSYEFDNFSFLPTMSLSWNSELSTSGEPLRIVSRKGEIRVFTQFDYNKNNIFRIPDSGLWLMAFTFDWQNNLSTSITYGQNFSAEIDVSSWSLDVSIEF